MTSITFKDNISFMYIIMESLRQEIRDEMKSLRVNKKHVYDILLRLVDELDGAKPVAPAPVVEPTPAPVAAPEPVVEAPPAPVEEAPKPVKKVVRRTRKKVEAEPKLSA
jgi:hypothetical protein